MLLTPQAGHFGDLPPERLRLLVTALLTALIVHAAILLAVWQTWGRQVVLPALPPLEISLVSPALRDVIQPAPAIQPPPVQTTTPPASKKTLSQPAPKTPVQTQAPGQEPAAEPVRQTETVSQPVESKQEVPAPQVTAARTEPAVVETTPPSFDAAYLNNPKPDYPPAAKRMGMEGVVLLRVMVNPAGVPEKVSVLNSSGSRLLDEAAVNTVYQWTFVPARQGNKPVSGSVNVPIRFVMD